jgi:hypothetical protein
MKTNIQKLLIFTLPITIALHLYGFGWITELLTMASDITVAIGIILVCLFITADYFLYKLFEKHFFKNNNKNQ